jgi:apolipoprotein N-acyltransferase
MRFWVTCLSSAVFVGVAVSLPHEGKLLGFASIAVGILGLAVLVSFTRHRPVVGLALWGGLYLPISGAWVVPAFDTPSEIFLFVTGLAVCGAVFYGGAGFVLSLMLRSVLDPVRWLILPLAIPLAEYAAMQTGFVMAPVGLLAVAGGWAWSVTLLGATWSGAILVLAAILLGGIKRTPPRLAVLIGLVLVTIMPAPPYPDYYGPEIFPVAHNPDPTDKWTPQGAQAGLAVLRERSQQLRDQDLIVWPENAVSGTFDLDEALALIGETPRPLLFGMTRYAQAGSPILHNSAVLIDAGSIQFSDKMQLAPVMETGMPFGPRTDLRAGVRRLLTFRETTILPLICYEIAFPLDLTVFDERPDIIIGLSADAGFVVWSAQSVGNRHARARELETGVRVFRVSDVPTASGS